ncbi:MULTISPECIES: argininosuccinate synthase [unclassified Fusibacter]|uniref:argininosuccinate synthase n=1 Tax=unclassified Fusibacter TaxID=2624464 RepID=UPI0010111B12|nr:MULTISPECIES: argininosuccinate synthase [unclassified Fusibacter]MCK8059507.1 argininosuccinate synthase [Fusibacter sp. A2]NPE21029.1 argininosuccinate synthase [Fusibacter sp. A1]RXV62303.1 argininosuccinate synthase [Fusibacter sp. A1]
MKKKVILAYSGGLDTSVILTWLKEDCGYDVIAVCVNVGQQEDYQLLEEKAMATGAVKAMVMHAVDEFVQDYAFKGLKAGAIYEGDYLLGTAYARPLIAKLLVKVAKEEGAVAIVHGATGKGNDQVRFEATIKALAPDLSIIAPWREWSMKSREDLIDYAVKYGIPIPVSKKDSYSRDENIWHLSHEGCDLEDPWSAHPTSIYQLTSSIDDAPDSGEVITIDFEKGLPVAIGGVRLTSVEMLTALNRIGGKHGIGVLDIVENRLVGMKSRGVYETPGGTILHKAHQSLEKLVLDRDTLQYKQLIAIKYSELVYNGLWYCPLKTALDAFVEQTQAFVNGSVRIELKKGNIRILGTKSPDSLYSFEHVTFGEDQVYDQKDAQGFINLFTLPLKLTSMLQPGKRDLL